MFDTGPIISLTLNNLSWLLPLLKERFKGEFLITEAVRGELVDRPLESRFYRFEAMQTASLIRDGVLAVLPRPPLERLAERLLAAANGSFVVKGQPVKVVHYAEMETLAAAVQRDAPAIVVDERTTRKLIEEPLALKAILEARLHTRVQLRRQRLEEFRRLAGTVRVLRSFELVVIAYEHGLLDRYRVGGDVLEAALWALKMKGCACAEDEIALAVSSTETKSI